MKVVLQTPDFKSFEITVIFLGCCVGLCTFNNTRQEIHNNANLGMLFKLQDVLPVALTVMQCLYCFLVSASDVTVDSGTVAGRPLGC